MVHIALAAALALSPASATLVECERTPQPAAEFEARMGMVPGAAQLQMRFTLQAVNTPRRRWRHVAAPGFDEWTTADPGTTRYVYTRRVEALIGPAQYRVRVRFRWLDAAGTTIARTVRHSRSCRVPDLRPNLTIAGLTTEPARDAAERRYLVRVHNTGRGDAAAFTVAVAGQDPVVVDGLAAHAERVIEVVGPVCAPGGSIEAVADPADLIEERSERDNAFSVDC